MITLAPGLGQVGEESKSGVREEVAVTMTSAVDTSWDSSSEGEECVARVTLAAGNCDSIAVAEDCDL